MTEQVLTDDEKNALLDGVQSGAVEVHTASGQKYADVRAYELPAGARIRSNSYPQLKVLNQQVADRLARYIDKTLHCEISVTAEQVSGLPFNQVRGTFESPPAVIVFSAPPLQGRALLMIDAATIGQLTEGFYGGGSNAPASAVVTFSPGEISVCRLFGDAVLKALGEVWQPLIALKPQAEPPVIGVDLLESLEDRDAVLASRFDVRFADTNGSFSLVWPRDMVASLLPVFDGHKRDRDAAADARWQKAWRACLPATVVRVAVTVADVRKQLGALSGLRPGDVIDIVDPQAARVLAGDRPVLRGRFGVLAGRNAIEMTGWIGPDSSH